jgi:hypothetical protein
VVCRRSVSIRDLLTWSREEPRHGNQGHRSPFFRPLMMPCSADRTGKDCVPYRKGPRPARAGLDVRGLSMPDYRLGLVDHVISGSGFIRRGGDRRSDEFQRPSASQDPDTRRLPPAQVYIGGLANPSLRDTTGENRRLPMDTKQRGVSRSVSRRRPGKWVGLRPGSRPQERGVCGRPKMSLKRLPESTAGRTDAGRFCRPG